MIQGFDYASVDGNTPPDFHKVKAAGIGFCVIRGAWGTYVDPDLARDMQAGRDAGLVMGTYLFLRYPELGQPAPSPADQARTLIGAYGKGDPSDLPVTVDVEFPGRGIVDTGLTPQQALEQIVSAVGVLECAYPTVMIYTSARVWAEDLGNIAAGALGDCPLWVKTPYLYRARQPIEIPVNALNVANGLIPPPWHGAAWIQQFQGDAIGAPGFSSTVDVNRFLPSDGALTDARATWIHQRTGGGTIQAYQAARGLVADGIIGPRTFAALCR